MPSLRKAAFFWTMFAADIEDWDILSIPIEGWVSREDIAENAPVPFLKLRDDPSEMAAGLESIGIGLILP